MRLSTLPHFSITLDENFMDELSYLGIGFATVIFGLACILALKLASRSAYH